jgi:hemerythrin superfamily protein
MAVKKKSGGRDATVVLRDDHRTVEALFRQFEQASSTAGRKKKKLVRKMVDELALHADLEEQVFYPAVQAAAKDEDIVLKAIEEHGLVRTLLRDLQKMEPSEEHFEPKVRVLMEQVRHHIEEEEGEMFPKVREALTKDQLKDLGRRLEEGKAAISNPKDYLNLG